MTSNPSPTSWVPRSYQVDGVELMISQACAGLLYKPGRGKTSVAYMAFRILQEKGFVSKMLVICPLRPMHIVWPEQKDKYLEFKHLKVNVLHGPDKEAKLRDDSADIYVVNPEGLNWLFGAVKTGGSITVDKARLEYVTKKFPMLVVDESTKFRDSQTNRFKILKQAVKKFRRRYILTGTPTPKSLEDLFGQIYILDEGLSLGRYITHYRTQYFYPSGYGGYDWSPQPGARDRIMEKIAPLVQVVERGQDEPKLFYNDIYIDLDPASFKRYQWMENLLVTEMELGRIVAANAAVASGKCRQICNGGIFDENGDWEPVHNLKIDAVKDLIEQLDGAPLLVTYEFEFDKEELAAQLKIPCISTGNIKHDTEWIRKFARGEVPVVMGHPQSVSLGTDGLQNFCRDICMVGVTWNFLDYEQVIDRVRRTGNPHDTVTVHRILARNTIDERVIEVIENRDKFQSGFMGLLKKVAEERRLAR